MNHCWDNWDEHKIQDFVEWKRHTICPLYYYVTPTAVVYHQPTQNLLQSEKRLAHIADFFMPGCEPPDTLPAGYWLKNGFLKDAELELKEVTYTRVMMTWEEVIYQAHVNPVAARDVYQRDNIEHIEKLCMDSFEVHLNTK